MGLLKKIFWPDHPIEVAEKKDQEDIDARSGQRISDSLLFDELGRFNLPIARRLRVPEWPTEYAQNPCVDDYDGLMDEFQEQLGFFTPLNERVPYDISLGMPKNVKKNVVRDFWHHVTVEAYSDLHRYSSDLANLCEGKSDVGCPELDQYNAAMLRLSLTDIYSKIADSGITRARWDSDSARVQFWQEQSEEFRRVRLDMRSNAISSFLVLRSEHPELSARLGLAHRHNLTDDEIEAAIGSR